MATARNQQTSPDASAPWPAGRLSDTLRFLLGHREGAGPGQPGLSDQGVGNFGDALAQIGILPLDGLVAARRRSQGLLRGQQARAEGIALGGKVGGKGGLCSGRGG